MMPEKNRQLRMMQNSAMSLGIEFIVMIGIFIAIGYAVDRWLGCLPGFTIAGFGLGFAGALYRLIRQAAQFNQKCDADKNDNQNEK